MEHKFYINQIVSDNMGAKWIVIGYVFGAVSVRPQPDDAYKEYGKVLMPENMLHAVK